MEKLNQIKLLLREKGHSYWIDENGNVLMIADKQPESKKRILDKIRKNPEDWIGKFVAHVYITTDSHQMDVDSKQGCVEFDFTILEVKRIRNNIVFNLRDDTNSLFRFYYRSNELDKFKRSHIKILATKLIKNEIIVNAFQFYHYDDFKEYLL